MVIKEKQKCPLLFYLMLFFVITPIYAGNILKKVCFNNTCIQAEVAETADDLERGLMYREKIAEDSGMLFIFPDEARHDFWMKNMRFSLDIIWINQNKEIVAISEAVPLCAGPCESFSASKKVKYVLEVNAGFTRNHNILAGERINF